jgi:hypothetical protein
VTEPTGGESAPPSKSPEEAALHAWLDDVLARTKPPRLRIEEGETLADATERVLDLEESRVRSSAAETPVLRSAKLEAVASIRKSLGIGVRTPAASGGGLLPGEATFELTLGGIEGQPLTALADLVQMWLGVVDGPLGKRAPEARRRRFRRVEVGLVAGEGGARELVVWFSGTSDMIAIFRSAVQGPGPAPV